jgi:hypothetical protein
MFVAALGFIWLGYPLLAILVPRVVHDVTAFAFYSTHDCNRNLEKTRNLFYRLVFWIPIPRVVLVPLVAIAITFPVLLYVQNGGPFAIELAVAVTLMHYYTDAFVWKSGSLHRASIRFS